MPLCYVIRKDAVVPATDPPFAEILGGSLYPYSTEYVSVEGELVA